MSQRYVYGESPELGIQEASIKPCYSKFGPQTSSTSIPWDLVLEGIHASLLSKGLQSPGLQGSLRAHWVWEALFIKALNSSRFGELLLADIENFKINEEMSSKKIL